MWRWRMSAATGPHKMTRHDAERIFVRNTCRAGTYVSRPNLRCADLRTWDWMLYRSSEMETQLNVVPITCRKRERRRNRSWPMRLATAIAVLEPR